MWLPRDERILLIGYFKILSGRDVGRSLLFRKDELQGLVDTDMDPLAIPTYSGATDGPDEETDIQGPLPTSEQIRTSIAQRTRFELANKMLETRGFITVTSSPSNHSFVTVALTLEGYDLGRRYVDTWTRSALWFGEYKDHWAWLILAAVAGGLSSRVLDGIGWIFVSIGNFMFC